MNLAQRHGHPISLLLIDIDYFKSVNDRFGYQAGDKVLKRTATILHSAKRSTDILARYGGEEFALLMLNTEGDRALYLCMRLHAALEKDQKNSSSNVPPVTVSIGVACSSQHGYDYDHLLSKADKALYQAKDKGRNTSVSKSKTKNDRNWPYKSEMTRGLWDMNSALQTSPTDSEPPTFSWPFKILKQFKILPIICIVINFVKLGSFSIKSYYINNE